MLLLVPEKPDLTRIIIFRRKATISLENYSHFKALPKPLKSKVTSFVQILLDSFGRICTKTNLTILIEGRRARTVRPAVQLAARVIGRRRPIAWSDQI